MFKKQIFSSSVSRFFSFFLGLLFCVLPFIGIELLFSQGTEVVKLQSEDTSQDLYDRLTITEEDGSNVCYVNIKKADLVINEKGTATAGTSYDSYQCELVGSGWSAAAKSVYWRLQSLVDDTATISRLAFLNEVERGSETEYASLYSSGMFKLNPVSAPTCDTNAKGGQYYDSGADKMYYCNGSDWQDMTGGGGGDGCPSGFTDTGYDYCILTEEANSVGLD